MMVENVDALVAYGAVLRPLRRDGDVAKVASTVLDDVKMLRTIQLRHRFLRRNAEVRVCRVDQQGAKVKDKVEAVEYGVKDVKRCLEIILKLKDG